MNTNTVVNKYLSTFAESDIAAVKMFGYHFENVVVIPSYNEHDELLDCLASFTEKNTLVILVVNATKNTTKQVLDTNSKTIKHLRKNYFEIWRSKTSQGVSLHQMETAGLLLVDRSSGNLTLQNKNGVGLARKIGADIALKLIADNAITTQWIHSTDADVLLPDDYFSQTASINNSAVAVNYSYRHILNNGCDKQVKAMQLYELSLRHYVIGLKQATSPYAFHTIGSAFAIRAEKYAAVRGFPKREAGEDFYMLNKLAKLGMIEQLNGKPIILSGRTSDRVPYGTGKAVDRIRHYQSPLDDFLFYDPTLFKVLKTWLSELHTLTPICNLKKFEERFRHETKYPQLISGLEKLGAFHAIKNILKHTHSETSYRQQLHTWFDGFRTMKLIHHLRDNGFPGVTLTELLQHDPFNKNTIDTDDLSIVSKTFFEIENQL